MLASLYAVVYLGGCFALGVVVGLTLPSPTGVLAAGALLVWWYALGTSALIDWWAARQQRQAALVVQAVQEDTPCSS